MDRKKVFGRIIIAYLAVCAAQTLLSVIGALREKGRRPLPGGGGEQKR